MKSKRARASKVGLRLTEVGSELFCLRRLSGPDAGKKEKRARFAHGFATLSHSLRAGRPARKPWAREPLAFRQAASSNEYREARLARLAAELPQLDPERLLALDVEMRKPVITCSGTSPTTIDTP